MIHCLGYGRRWVVVDGIVTNTLGDRVVTTDYSDGGCEGTVEIYRDGEKQRGPGYTQRIRWHHRFRYQGAQ